MNVTIDGVTNLKAFALAAVSCSFLAAFGDAAVTNILLKIGDYNRPAYTNNMYWAALGTETPLPSGPLDPQADYWVHSNRQLSIINNNVGSYPFGGRSLLIGADNSNGYLGYYPYGTAVTRFDRLIFRRGSMTFQMSDSGKTVHAQMEGDVTVEAQSAGRAITVRGDYNNQIFHLRAKLHGTPQSALRLCLKENAGTYCTNMTFRLEHADSDYAGLISLDAGTYTAEAGSPPHITLALGTAPVGAVTLANFTALAATVTNAVTVGNLTLADKSVLVCDGTATDNAATHTTFTVTNALTLASPSAKVYVRLTGIPFAADAQAHTIDLLTAPAGANLNLDNFVLLHALPAVSMAIRTNAVDNTHTLCATCEAFVRLVVSDEKTNNHDGYTSALDGDHAASWSDGIGPREGIHALVGMDDDASSMYLRMMAMNTTTDFAFPGKSLTIGPKGTIVIFTQPLKTTRLRLLDGATVQNGQWSGPSVVKGGTIEVPSGRVSLRTFDSHQLRFDSSLTGGGRLVTRGPTASSNPWGRTLLNGDNSGFTGTCTVTSDVDPKTPDSGKCQHFTFASSAAIGAALPAFDPKALEIARWGVLTQAVSVACADTNRGLYVATGAQIFVAPGQTVSWAGATTYYGHLIKADGGTLALGGTARFDSSGGITETPVAGCNLLTVAGGAIKPLSAHAFDGVAISLAEGASLAFDADTADATLLAEGLCNVKTGSAFVCAGDTLPIVISRAGASPVRIDRCCDMGLLTLPSATAEAVADKLRITVARGTFASPVKTQPMTWAHEQEGTVTLGVRLLRVGLTVIFR